MGGKKRVKKERYNFVRRVQGENVRRMLIASVSFFVLFFAISIGLRIQTAVQINSSILWIYLIFTEVYAGVYIWISYQWLSSKRKWDMRMELYLFWTIFLALMLALSFILSNTFFTLCVFWIMTAILAVIPLWSNKEFFISQGIQLTAILVLIYYQNLTLESVVYLVANQLMCCIISRQGYYNFQQRAADANAIDTVKVLSETDPMTSLLNRRGLECSLNRIWPRTVHGNWPVAVIMIDIDNFKKYNDYFGHLEGDNCIRRVTAEIHKCILGKWDFAARVGGEEFVVCLPGIQKSEALKWAEKLKKSVEGLNIPQAKDNFLPMVSVSIGVTWEYAREQADFYQMQKKADVALYLAKKSGRACICLDGECHAKTRDLVGMAASYLERGFRFLG